MKTNGIPSQMKAAWNQAQTTFGAAQEVRKAIDNGGLAGGMSEGINQYCKNKGGAVAQVLAGFSNSSLGKFFLKKLLHLNFNEHGDSVEIKTDDIAKAMGQDGKLGGYLLDVIGGGQDGWLSKTCSTVCTKCSNVVSHAVESLVNKIQNETIREGITNILSHDESSAKTRSKEEAKTARKNVFEKISANLKDIKTMKELSEKIEEYEVTLEKTQEDKLKISWAIVNNKLNNDKNNDNFVKHLFKNLSSTTKEALGYDDTSQSTKDETYEKAINALKAKEQDKWDWLDNNCDW